MSDEFTPADCRIGTPHPPIQLTSREENRKMAARLAAQSQLEILIISRDLDPMVFGHHEFTDHIGQFIRNRRASMRILVNQPQELISSSHRIAEMAISYSSKISIRKLAATDQGYNEAWLLCDEVALLHRPRADAYTASVDCYTPRRGRELSELFEKFWADAELVPELRALKI